MAKGLILYLDIDTGYYPGLHHGLAYLMGSANAKPGMPLNLSIFLRKSILSFRSNALKTTVGILWESRSQPIKESSYGNC